MFTIDQLFAQMFPWIEGVSWDLGTILIATVFIWVIIMAFGLIKDMLSVRLANNQADFYYEKAEEALNARMESHQGSIEWEQNDMLYKRYLRKSVDSKMKDY